ncbi:hypothetical protein LDENG_00285710 [Lucifuga dentata]|nr:hypothetical protein LDENG_00285710 [Lucifuga dentata]
MDVGSITAESTNAIVIDESPTDERETREACQSEIPAVSLCPPDSMRTAEAPLMSIQSEEGLCDSCSSLDGPSSSCQHYHQVSQGPRVRAYDSPQHKQHQHGCHQEPIKSNTCHDCTSDTAGPHADCSAGDVGDVVKVGHSCSSTHQTSCQSTVRCHWLHGSHESGAQKPTQRHVVTLRDGGLYCILRNYSYVIVDHPLVALVGCAVLLLGCSLAGLFIGPLPDFSDPLLGFEPRGTYIGVRQSSLSKLQENTGPGKALSPLPQQLSKSFGGVVSGDGSQDSSRLRVRRMLARDSSPDTFLCDAPGERLAQLVFRSDNSASLWSLKSIHAMCEMEQSRIRSQAHFQDLCHQHVRVEAEEKASRGGCCPSWSLGNYLAVLTNASCCLSLTSQQVFESLSLLRYCAPYYHEGYLVEACVERPKYGSCFSVPSRCKQSHMVFQILHFLVDKDFLGPQTVEYQIPTLKYSLLFLPVDKGEHMVEIYMNSLEGRDLTYNNTTITGIDFGIKQTLFKYYLVRDSVYPVLAVVSLLFTMALYLQSFFIVALSVIVTTGSLLTSYFLYKVAFRLTFFPMVNLSAGLILLGSCSNQVFTFADFWTLQISQNPSASLEKRVNRALQESLCCFFGPHKNCGKIMLPCLSEQTDSRLSSCSTAEPGCSSALAANGAFGRSRVRRSYDKDAGGYLYPSHKRQQQQKQIVAGVGGGQGPEQYELQPLAYRLSDSFENSTCTSKLSNQPSVFSDETEYCGRDVGGNSIEGDSEEKCSHQHKICQQPPVLQTSSPYKQNILWPVDPGQENLMKDRLLCKTCRSQSGGVKHWATTTFSSSSSIEESIISHTLETIVQPSLCKEEHTTEERLQHHHYSQKGLLSSQSQSSCEGLEDSNETCLSDIEPGPSNTQQNEGEEEDQLQPGHLNGKRDTLRLSLKETFYETCGRGHTSQSEQVVILPNSKPDLPDVWIKRDGQRKDTC